MPVCALHHAWPVYRAVRVRPSPLCPACLQDVFSFGVILWELLTFQVPWEGIPSTWQVGLCRSLCWHRCHHAFFSARLHELTRQVRHLGELSQHELDTTQSQTPAIAQCKTCKLQGQLGLMNLTHPFISTPVLRLDTQTNV
jgi:hypothetical protein